MYEKNAKVSRVSHFSVRKIACHVIARALRLLLEIGISEQVRPCYSNGKPRTRRTEFVTGLSQKRVPAWGIELA